MLAGIGRMYDTRKAITRLGHFWALVDILGLTTRINYASIVPSLRN